MMLDPKALEAAYAAAGETYGTGGLIDAAISTYLSARNIIQEFSDLPDRDKHYVVRGAVFLMSLGILLAIWCFGGNDPKHPKPNQRKDGEND